MEGNERPAEGAPLLERGDTVGRSHAVDACIMKLMRTTVTAERLFDGSRMVNEPVVEIEDGYVVSIGTRGERALKADARVLDFPGATLAPAFFDVHIHGGAGHDVMEATPAALDTMGRFLASRGTGSFLASTVTAPLDMTLRALSGLAKLIAKPSREGIARPVGIHLEGPFLSHAKRGVHPPEYLLAPDVATFDRLYEAAEGHVRLITLAPELPGATELTAHATGRGVRVSIGHSDANAAEARKGIASGAKSATHTFNAMRTLDHHEPGILGVALTENAIYAELICDGVHCAPEMARLWWRAKGAERAILVTDAMSAAGMPDGEYQLGGFPVQVANGRAMARGVLAGSVLTLDRALENLVAFAGARPDDALRAVTTNPAAMIGIGDAGRIAAGMPANLVALDTAGRLVAAAVQSSEFTVRN